MWLPVQAISLTGWPKLVNSCLLLQDAENNWQFDIFGFAEATKGTTLSLLFYHFMKQSGIIQEFHLDEVKLCKYAQKIESGYDANNPYHNRLMPCILPFLLHTVVLHRPGPLSPQIIVLGPFTT